jgi:ADP-ribose pyrophosphatase
MIGSQALQRRNNSGCCVRIVREGQCDVMAEEQTVWSDYAFTGKLIKVRLETVRIAGVGLREREIVEHPGAVGILPVLQDGRIALVRQYRPAVGRQLLEIPAGTLEPGESASECARRELVEETGYHAGKIEELTRFFVSPGWCNEELTCFLATDLRSGEQRAEDDEKIDVALVRADETPGLMQSGEIGDAKTIVSLLAFFARQP